MITIKHPIDFPETYPLDRIGPKEQLLFFDIGLQIPDRRNQNF